MLPTRTWTDMSTLDFREAEMENVIAVLPVAAVEQHGPHLPVGTDLFIMQGYLDRLIGRLPAELPVLFLPVQPVGASQEHLAFPGTLSMPPAVAAAGWTAMAESVARTGCRKIVLLNSHGGNVPLLQQMALDLRVRLGMLAVVASWHAFGYPDGLFSAHERAHGIHGGEIETALMLAFRPDLVRRRLAEDFVPASVAMAHDFNWLNLGRPVGFGWMAQDVSPSGAMGNAAAATPDKGAASADYGATAFTELLRDVEAFDVSRFKAL